MSIASSINEIEKMFGSYKKVEPEVRTRPNYSVKDAISEIEKSAFGKETVVSGSYDYKGLMRSAYRNGLISWEELSIVNGKIERIRRIVKREEREFGRPLKSSFRDYFVDSSEIL